MSKASSSTFSRGNRRPAGKRRKQNRAARRRLFYETLEERLPLAIEAEVDFMFFAAGTTVPENPAPSSPGLLDPVGGIHANDDVILAVYITDVRPAPQTTGMFQAYFDIYYDDLLISPPPASPDPIVHGTTMAAAAEGDVLTSGLIDEVGGLDTDTIRPADPGQQTLLFSLPFHADAPGTLVLGGDLAEQPTLTVNFFEPSNAIPLSHIRFNNVTWEIGVDEIALLTVGDTQADEGDNLVFPISADNAVPGGFDVDVAFHDVTAQGSGSCGVDDDYVNATQTVHFDGDAGESHDVTVTTCPDALLEGTETVTVSLTASRIDVNDDDTAIGTILDDENWDNGRGIGVRFVEPSSMVGEGTPAHTVHVELFNESGLTIQLGLPITVDVVVGSGGTADTPADFTLDTTTITFPTGSTTGSSSAAIDLSIVDDHLVESDETIRLELANLVIVGLDPADDPNDYVRLASTNHPHIVTIDDNETPPQVRFCDPDSTTTEDTTHSVCVELELDAGDVLAEDLAVDVVDLGSGSATTPDDYVQNTVTVTFEAGSVNGDSRLVPFAIAADNLVEGDETIELELQSLVSTISGAAIDPTQHNHTVTIDDNNDDVGVSLRFGGPTSEANEGDTPDLDIELTLAPGDQLAIDVCFDIAILGTPGPGVAGADDVSLPTLPVCFGSDGGLPDDAIDILVDTLVEGDEELVLQLQNLTTDPPVRTDISIDGTANEQTITVHDANELTATVGFCNSSSMPDEGTTQSVCVELNLAPGDELAVPLTVDVFDLGTGTAITPDDYAQQDPSVTFPVGSVNGAQQFADFDINSDNLVEGDETIDLQLQNLTAPTTTGASIDVTNDAHQISIHDTNDNSATVAFCDPASNPDEDVTYSVCVELNLAAGDQLAIPLTVDVVDLGSGSAITPGDYAQQDLSVTFSVGSVNGAQQFADFDIDADNLVEGNETINLELQNLTATTPTDASIDDTRDEHLVTINDNNDDSATIAFCDPASNPDEGVTYSVCVELDLATGDQLAIPLTVDIVDLGTGTAITPDDYAQQDLSVTFPAGNGDGTQQFADFDINSDNLVEGDETINLELQNLTATTPTDASIDGALDHHQITIHDNNGGSATIAFCDPASTTPEGTTHSVCVELNLAPGDELAVPLTVDVFDLGTGTAITPDDFAQQDPSVTFPVGSVDGAQQFADFDINLDNLVEGDETIDLQLQNLTAPTTTGASIDVTNDAHQISINDTNDNSATVAFCDPTSNPDEDVTHSVCVELTLAASDQLAIPLTVDVVDLGSGSAITPGDYAQQDLSVTFSVGSVNGAQQFADFDIDADNLVEGNETINLELQNLTATTPTDASIDGALDDHQITIHDNNDDGVLLRFGGPTSNAAEGDTLDLDIEMTLAAGDQLAIDVCFDIAILGTPGPGVAGPDDVSLPTMPLCFGSDGSLPVDAIDILLDALVEGAEELVLQLRNLTVDPPVGTDIAVDDAADTQIITIDDANDDGTSVTIGFCDPSSTPDEGTTQSICVELSLVDGDKLAIPLTVDVADLGTGTATTPDDYEQQDLSVTFPVDSVNGTQQSATFQISSDDLVEGDETINLQLQNLTAPTPTNASIDGANDGHQVVINDMNEVVVYFVEAGSSVHEDQVIGTTVAHFVTIEIGSTGTLATPVCVQVADLGTGTATNPADYTGPDPPSFCFDAGTVLPAQNTVTLTIESDGIDELRETVDLELRNLDTPGADNVKASIDTDRQDHTVSVFDPSVPVVWFDAATSDPNEGTEPHTISVVLGLASGITLLGPLTVDVVDLACGSADGSLDYHLLNSQVVFPTGSTNGDTVDVEVEVVADTLIEGNETFCLQLQNLGNSAIAFEVDPARSDHTSAIEDMNTAAVQFVQSTSDTREDIATHDVDVQLVLADGDELATPIVIDVADLETGTATPGGDYTFTTASLVFPIGGVNGDLQSAPVSPLTDNLIEGDETIDLQLQNLAVADGVKAEIVPDPANHTMTMEDMNEADVAFCDPNSGGQEADTHAVCVELILADGDELATPISVDVVDAATGTATPGVDFTFTTTTLVFPVGSVNGATQNATVPLLTDNLVEGDETIILQLQNLSAVDGAKVEIVPDPANHTVTIEDMNEADVAFCDPNSGGQEADTHTVCVELVLADGDELATPIDLDAVDLATGTATPSADYTFTTATLGFPVGSVNGDTQNTTVSLLTDNLVEGDETINLQLQNLTVTVGVKAEIVDPADHVVTIEDMNDADVAFCDPSSGGQEGDTHAVCVALILADGDELATTIRVDVVDLVTGSATTDDDYTFTTTPITFPIGSVNGATQNAVVSLLTDNLVEGDETIDLQLQTLTAADGVKAEIVPDPANHTVTIEDMNEADVAFCDPNSGGQEGDTHTVCVELILADGDQLATPIGVDGVDLETGSATPGVDDSFTATPIEFPVGSVNGDTQSATAQLLTDNLVEGDETINLQLQNLTVTDGVKAEFVDPADHVVTIEDMNEADVAFCDPSSNGQEGDTHAVCVELILADGDELATPIGVDVVDLETGSAMPGVDYTFTTTTIEFPVGSVNGVTQNAAAELLTDHLVEGSETINLQPQNLAVADGVKAEIVPDPANHTVTIEDMNEADVAFCDPNSSGQEGDTHAVCVELILVDGDELATPIGVDVVDLETGSATPGVDYTFTTTPITFPIGSVNGATQNATVSLLTDNLVEGNETIDLQLQNPSAADGVKVDIVPDPANHTVTIEDINEADVAFCDPNSGGQEGDTHSVCVELILADGDALATPIRVDGVDLETGSATPGVDYTFSTTPITFPVGSANGDTQNATVQLPEDNFVEGDETTNLQLQNLSAADGVKVEIVDPANHVVTIEDMNEADVAFCDPSSGGQEGNTHTVCVELILTDGDELATPIRVDVVDLETGSATPDDDYTFTTTSIEFPVGSVNGDTQNATVQLLEDNLVESDETINFQLQNLTVADGVKAEIVDPANHVLTIGDENILVAEVCFASRESNGDEGTVHSIVIELGLAPDDKLAVPLTVTIDDVPGTAGNPDDYALVAASITFPVDSIDGATASLQVDLESDHLVEGTEDFQVSLASAALETGETVRLCVDSSFRDHQITIQDMNPVRFFFEEASSNAPEAVTPHQFNVELDLDSGDQLAVTVTVDVVDTGDGTATPDDDYDFTTTTISFDSGDTDGTTKSVDVAIVSDSTYEGDQTIVFTLESVDGPTGVDASVVTPAQHEVTILDNTPPPTVSLSVDDDIILEDGGQATVTATLSEVSEIDGSVTVKITGTATYPDDYGINTDDPNVTLVDPSVPLVKVSIPAGEESVSFTVVANTDETEDPDETVDFEIVDQSEVTPVQPTTSEVMITEDPMTGRISGRVWVDIDSDGEVDSNETRLPVVTVTLTGVDRQDQVVEITTLTDSAGEYHFVDLPSGTYSITETQPAAFLDGAESLGTVDGTESGTAGADVFENIELPAAGIAVDYNFGEGSLASDFISRRIFLASRRTSTTNIRDVMAQAERQVGNESQAVAIEQGEAVQIRRIGSEVTVIGTNQPDQISFAPASSINNSDSTSHVLEANGVEWKFSASEVSVFYIDAASNHDEITLRDSTEDDTLEAQSNKVVLSGDSYRVEVTQAEQVRAISESGGTDTEQQQAIDYVLELEGDWLESTA